MVKIKICGITNFDDARLAIEAGADMLGFNFYRPSPRFIEPEQARKTRELVPQLFLSGGLAPENVAGAIDRVQPYAVDACSRLELSPGWKDPSRVTAFVRAARSG